MANSNRGTIDFGLRIRSRRIDLDLTLEQLAERADLTPQYIGSIENGLRDPSLTTMEKLAHGLGVPLGALLGELKELSPKASEMARLFERVSTEIQVAVLILLRTLSKR